MSALTKDQKRYLSQQSDRLYNLDAAKARGRGETPDVTTKARATFRHGHVIAACGKHGLRCCSQEDFATVKAHFQNALGEPGQALKTLVHGDDNARRQVEWKITRACAALGKSVAYAHGICKQRFHGLHIADASVRQLWGIYFALVKHQQRQNPAA